MSLVYLLDLQGGLTGGSTGYSRWVPSTMGNSQGTRAKVAEIRKHLNGPSGRWDGAIESHPGLPSVAVDWKGVGAESGVAETSVEGETGTLLVIARGDDPQATDALRGLLIRQGVPGAQNIASVVAERRDRPLFVRGNWIRGSAAEASIELAQLWVAMAFFEERGVI